MSLFDYKERKPIKDSKPMVWAIIDSRPQILVPSHSRNGLMHEVKLTHKGWVCDCEDFQYRPDNAKTIEPCKHILRVKNAILSGKLMSAGGVAFTSLVAYSELKSSGVWNQDCAEILELIMKYPDVSDKDIQRIWNAQLRKQNRYLKAISSVTGRRNELERDGFIYQNGTKKNRQTNKPNMIWKSVFEEVNT